MADLGTQPGIVTKVTSTDVAIYWAPALAPLVVGYTFKAATGTYAIGTLVGERTSDNKGGKYVESAADGLDVAVGIILDQIDTTDGDQSASVLVGCALIEIANLTGADAGANYVTDLNGRRVLNNTVLVF